MIAFLERVPRATSGCCWPALISLRNSDKVSSASAPLLESSEMRLSGIFHGNTTAARDRPGQ